MNDDFVKFYLNDAPISPLALSTCQRYSDMYDSLVDFDYEFSGEFKMSVPYLNESQTHTLVAHLEQKSQVKDLHLDGKPCLCDKCLVKESTEEDLYQILQASVFCGVVSLTKVCNELSLKNKSFSSILRGPSVGLPLSYFVGSVKTIYLKTQESYFIPVSAYVMKKSPFFRDLIDGVMEKAENRVVPVKSYTRDIVLFLVEYLEEKAKNPDVSPVSFSKNMSTGVEQKQHTYIQPIPLWDLNFINKIGTKSFTSVAMLGSSFQIHSLVELYGNWCAQMTAKMSVDEMREFFKTSNDFSNQQYAEAKESVFWRNK